MAKDTQQLIREFLSKAGTKGGRARARKYPKSVLRQWAKRGGRPRKESKAKGA